MAKCRICHYDFAHQKAEPIHVLIKCNAVVRESQPVYNIDYYVCSTQCLVASLAEDVSRFSRSSAMLMHEWVDAIRTHYPNVLTATDIPVLDQGEKR